MKTARNVLSGANTIGELLQYLWAQRLWWLIPFVVTLLLIGSLLLAAQASGIAPFIYTLF